MSDSTNEHERKALATVSTLKRVFGIPNHPSKKDNFKDGFCHIFTTDEESATLLGELLYRYGNGPREKFYNSRAHIRTIRDSIQIESLPDEGFDISMRIPWPTAFGKALEKMVSKHTSPDNRFQR